MRVRVHGNMKHHREASEITSSVLLFDPPGHEGSDDESTNESTSE
jgi:hypothetical protein